MKTVETDGNVYIVKDNDGNTYGVYLTRGEADARLKVVRVEHRDYFDADVNIEDEIFLREMTLGDYAQ
jgi:hypothetical protein